MRIPAINRQFRHILCPVDFSDYSRTALRYASGPGSEKQMRPHGAVCQRSAAWRRGRRGRV